MYRKSIIEAVREWRPAFEQAGFKNAIDARLAPTAKEDPDFCMYDNHYAYISWKISGMSNAYGPTPCEGRSGEIMGCHVGVFSSVMDEQRGTIVHLKLQRRQLGQEYRSSKFSLVVSSFWHRSCSRLRAENQRQSRRLPR